MQAKEAGHLMSFVYGLSILFSPFVGWFINKYGMICWLMSLGGLLYSGRSIWVTQLTIRFRFLHGIHQFYIHSYCKSCCCWTGIFFSSKCHMACRWIILETILMYSLLGNWWWECWNCIWNSHWNEFNYAIRMSLPYWISARYIWK